MRLTTSRWKHRWDSSDPDRAPPPLPLNPGSSSPVIKPNTSGNIAAAAEALTAKARESAYVTNPPPQKSPEKSLIKNQYHKRLQSFQNGSGGGSKERNGFFDSLSSPERQSRALTFDFENRSPERSPTRSGTPTPNTKDFGKDAPSLRPASRPAAKAILGENTPPSATMLSIQNMPASKELNNSLADITNGSSSMAKSPQTFDALSTQILSLTTIATNLQREMAQLSRRSKDNATDLISLKEATNSRDEDIRKSLRDLLITVSSRHLQTESDSQSRSSSHYSHSPSSLYIDSKPHLSPPSMSKSVSLPRIPSPSSFGAAMERELTSTTYNGDGAASIALLEKILREMATKEGQTSLLSSLKELQDASKLDKSNPELARKVDEILTLLKEREGSLALVPLRDDGNAKYSNPSKLVLDFDKDQSLRRVSRDAVAPVNRQVKAADFVTEDMQKLLKRMSNSITEGGGMTAEIKALVRELRGEVLGMGREIARKLEEADSTRCQIDKGDAYAPGRGEVAKIVEEALLELKEHMENIIREKRRQSSSSVVSRNTVDSQEVYTAVKNALSEIPLQNQLALQNQGSGIEREDILDAVREAWETYKPEIELQNFGLERDEILQCLREGLHEYRPSEQQRELGAVTYDEVLDAVQEGLRHFKPPAPVETEASVTREEILMTVRECLDTFEFPTSSVGTLREPEITREDVLDAVKEGLSTQAPISKEIEFNRDDLFEAVRAGLEGAPTPMGGVGEQVLDRMQDLIDGIRAEFKQYSAANGGDTEQVLDAMKDGLEVLRNDIESYVDRAADVTGKDEIIETVRDGLDHLRSDLENSIANATQNQRPTNNGELLDAMEKEFDHLRQTIASSMVRSGADVSDKDEILDTLRDEVASLKASILQRDPEHTTEVLSSMREDFEHLRQTLATTVIQGGPSTNREELIEIIKESLAHTYEGLERKHDRPESIVSSTVELVDALNDRLDGLRADIEDMARKPSTLETSVLYEMRDTLKEGLFNVKSEVDRLAAATAQNETSGRRGGEVIVADGEVNSLRRNDIENLEVMITQLKIKVDALDNMPPPPPSQPESSPIEGMITKSDLEEIEASLREIQASISGINQSERTQNEDAVTKDDTEAIETLLRNTKARLDEIVPPESGGLADNAQVEAVETLAREVRDVVQDFGIRFETETASKDDLGLLEAMLKEVRAGIEDLRERPASSKIEERIDKTHFEALESLCTKIKAQISELLLPDLETLPTKAELDEVSHQIENINIRMEEDANLTAQAFEARKIEHGGIADKIEDIKEFLEHIRQELKTKIVEGSHSVEDLAKTLENITETVVSADATTSVQDLRELVNREFDRSHGLATDSKLDAEQRHEDLLQRHMEHKDAIIAEVLGKIDVRFEEMMIKYDDAQAVAERKETSLGARDLEQKEIMNATRTIAEDLRQIIDALGSTLTESCERIGEDSKTVFNRVEDIGMKLNELVAVDLSSEHKSTRAEISKTLAGVEGVQAHVNEYHPKILEAVKDVLGIVGQHYEQAKVSTEELKSSVREIPSAIPLPAIAAPMLSPPAPVEGLLNDKYDDTEVHAKLDRLVQQAAEAGKADAHYTLLEQIRDQVALQANELNTFLLAQQARITESHDSLAKDAEEAAIAVEKRTAQKENVEADIMRLSEQKEELLRDVQDLKRNKDDLISQRLRAQADLSSLETALQIRREELQIMEARADKLERRILDGILDHSRSLITTSRPPSSLNDMNLKRVSSTASNATTATRSTVNTTIPSVTASAVSSGIGMALKRRQPTRSQAGSGIGSKSDRRILSLSTLGANKGPATERTMVLADPMRAAGTTKGTGFGMKRSHSVKSNFPIRKTSWGGTKALGMYADESFDEEADKENSILDEQEGEEDYAGSEAGTERRTSYTGTYAGTMSYGDGSFVSGDDRRTSYATSTVGTVGTAEGTLAEADEESESESLGKEQHLEEETRDDECGGQAVGAKGEISNAGEMVVFGLGSDSGIGTDMPTAAFEGGSDYFRHQ
ncbi:MAG: hypothetical protein Q9167_003076 [Letrouitia subvulpina]